jgi:hypothetical protein
MCVSPALVALSSFLLPVKPFGPTTAPSTAASLRFLSALAELLTIWAMTTVAAPPSDFMSSSRSARNVRSCCSIRLHSR